jgi:hypothetical protein
LLLGKVRFNQGCDFIENNARPLDKKLFDYHFTKGSANDVRKELMKYQNEDGGFGHAMEPDLRLKASSPIATSVGLQYCSEIELAPDDQIVEKAITYLLETYQTEDGYWPDTFMDVNDEPHAPWWHIDEIKPPSEDKWSNPNAELVGYMNRYSIHVPSDFLVDLNKRAALNIDRSEYIEGLIYDILCWIRTYPYLPPTLSKRAKTKIERTFQKIHPTIEETLREVRIFALAPSPNSLFYQLFPDEVNSLIKKEIENQAEDGGWWPTWEWGQYEDVWELAKVEWAGKTTVECLISLDDYDLIESSN